jgi:putative glutamine amidotransferase
MPIIGVTNCRKLEDYRQSVLHVGGEVRVLDAAADVAGVMAGLDGLLLTGGGDVDPSKYGEARHDTFSPTVEAGRDDFELALVRIARERELPILAICRGIQVLNVARGTWFRHASRPARSHQLKSRRTSRWNSREVWIDRTRCSRR